MDGTLLCECLSSGQVELAANNWDVTEEKQIPGDVAETIERYWT